MAYKALEKLVTELQSTVASLVIKISGLEEKICEQSEILRKHPGAILQTTGCHDTKVTTAHAQIAQEQLERSCSTMNNKRSSIAGSSNALANTNDTQPASDRDRRHLSRESAKQQRQPDQLPKPAKQTSAGKKPTVLPTIKAPSRTYADTTKPPQTARVLKLRDDDDNVNKTDLILSDDQNIQPPPISEGRTSNDDSTWTAVQTKRKQNRKRTVMIGTGNASESLRPAEHMKYLSVWSFEPSTTEESMNSFLQSQDKSDKYSVKKRLSHCGNYATFIIGMPSSLYSKISDVNIWPQRVRLMEWFLARPRQQQRGAVLQTTTN